MQLRSTLLLATLTLVGCGVNPPKQPRGDIYMPSQVHVDSESLRVDTAVGRPVATRDESGLLHVTIPVRSAIDKQLHIDYWITWFDRNGQPIGKFGPMPKTLEANTPDSITVVSTSPRAEDFQLDLRYPQ